MVRAENLRVLKQLMGAAGPNQVLNHSFDHLGDKRSAVREAILNVVVLALLTYPSYEFDLKVAYLFLIHVIKIYTHIALVISLDMCHKDVITTANA